MTKSKKQDRNRLFSPSVEEAKIVLERQLSKHAVELYPLLADPAVYHFIDEPMPQSCEALRERFRKLESGQSPDGTELWLNWVIRLDKRYAVGFVQATVYQDHTADIAYVLGKKYWGKGHAFAAVYHMLHLLATKYAVINLRALVDHRNTRSISLLDRLGLQPKYYIEDNGDVLYWGDIRHVLDRSPPS